MPECQVYGCINKAEEGASKREHIFQILYNTLFSREEIFAKSQFEIFSREDIFANILFTRKYLPAKISSRENIILRFFSVPQILIMYRLVRLGYAV